MSFFCFGFQSPLMETKHAGSYHNHDTDAKEFVIRLN